MKTVSNITNQIRKLISESILINKNTWVNKCKELKGKTLLDQGIPIYHVEDMTENKNILQSL